MVEMGHIRPARSLVQRQDPVSSTPESSPPSTSQPPPSTSSQTPTSSAPPTTSSPPSQSSSLPVVSETPTPTPTPTPTDPAGSSSVSSRSSASGASSRSVVSSLSNAGSTPAGTPLTTSYITTNSAGQSLVTVVVTSNYAVPTAPASQSSANTGAIVGGVVGGVGGLMVLIALLWFIRRIAKKKKDSFEPNMFEPDRNVNRPADPIIDEEDHNPETIARPYHLPASSVRPEMGMALGSRPLSGHSAHSHGRPLSSENHATMAMPRPTPGDSYYGPPSGGMSMPTPMPLSPDHIAHLQSRTNSTADYHSQPTTSEGMSDGGSSSARMLKEREARRLHVANNDNVVVHSDGGRVPEEADYDQPSEIPPTYESIGGPSGAR